MDPNLGLALAGAALGIIGLWMGREHSKELDHQASRLEAIYGSMSTRYIGTFPTYLPQIARLVAGARQHIVVACDIPNYGHFSAYADWVAYKSAVEAAVASNVSVDLLVLGHEKRVGLLRRQFNDARSDWAAWRAVASHRQLLERFVRLHELGSVDSLTYEAFQQALVSADAEALQAAFRGARVCETPEDLNLFFWIVDSERAIFTVPAFSEGATEHGFETSDVRLIRALESIFERYSPGAPLHGWQRSGATVSQA